MFPKEGVCPSLWSSGFILHREEVPGSCGTVSTKLGSFQRMALSQVSRRKCSWLPASLHAGSWLSQHRRWERTSQSGSPSPEGAVSESGTERWGLICLPLVPNNQSLGPDKYPLEPTQWLWLSTTGAQKSQVFKQRAFSRAQAQASTLIKQQRLP